MLRTPPFTSYEQAKNSGSLVYNKKRMVCLQYMNKWGKVLYERK